MRLVVLGAAGLTGRLVVAAAKADGHDVLAFARKTGQLDDSAESSIIGDATNSDDLRIAFHNADAVISTLNGDGTIISDSMRATIEAAHSAGIKRVTVLSSFAVLRDRLTEQARQVSENMMAEMVADKMQAEADLHGSDLDWIIVYATLLDDGPATDSAHELADDTRIGLEDKITRADVARWLVDVTVGDTFHRREVVISG